MSLRECVGQLFVIRPESIDKTLSKEDAYYTSKVGTKSVNKTMKEYYKKYPAGGFILFPKNISDPSQLLKFNKDLHRINKSINSFIYIDEEGGPVSRIAANSSFSVPHYKSMYEIGKNANPSDAYNAGKNIGEYLNKYKINVDFAPVADVNTNPKNPIIGIRAFSSNPQVVADMDTAFLRGLNEYTVKGCIKHFPGHGDTSKDTHRGYTEILKTWDELKECELIPFQKCIDNGVEFIMISHISLPYVTNSYKPSTLSYEIITEKLRNEMNFSGIIITDAMEMGAIQNEFTDENAAVYAILAGVDIILMPPHYEEYFNSIMDAVKRGIISTERIRESVKRILLMKELS